MLQYLKDIDDLNSKLSATQATADCNAALAQSAQHQCLLLLKEIGEKNNALKEYEAQVNKLGKQSDLLQEDLRAREFSQKQLKDEVVRMEHNIMQSLEETGGSCGCELRKILDEVSPKNVHNINKLVYAKDEEIVKLRDETRIMSAHWKLKTKDLESQVREPLVMFNILLHYMYTNLCIYSSTVGSFVMTELLIIYTVR